LGKAAVAPEKATAVEVAVAMAAAAAAARVWAREKEGDGSGGASVFCLWCSRVAWQMCGSDGMGLGVGWANPVMQYTQ
jgi:hypothetical protein